jgi:hypothetical protein
MSQRSMADPHSNQRFALEESLSAHDRLLIEKTEEAIRDGLQLEEWCREQLPQSHLFELDLGKEYRLGNRAEGFFDALEINGKRTTVMGCRQEVEFGKFQGFKGPDQFSEFVLGEFLKRAGKSYRSVWFGPRVFFPRRRKKAQSAYQRKRSGVQGKPASHGFTFEQNLCRTAAGKYARFVKQPPTDSPVLMDWRHLGTEYDWVALTVNINDFVMDFGPVSARFKEAAYVVAHPGFTRVQENPSREYIYEVSVGYAFVNYAPIHNLFGFGPGKFGTAVKLFSFFLTPQEEVRVRLIFAAAPRCQKVLDFGKFCPDPVYGGAKLFHHLSFGRWNPDPFHDRLDTKMLTQHCRVHQALMEGVEKVWREWLGDKASADANQTASGS